MAPTQLLLEPNPTTNALFGVAVAADGDSLAASTLKGIDSLGNRNGTVTLFRRDATGRLVRDQVLDSPGSLPGGYEGEFGTELALRGSRLIVAAPYEYRALDNVLGQLHCFEYDPTLGWFLTQTITDPPLGHPPSFGLSEYRGWRMKLSGDHLFVSFRHSNISGRIVYYHHDGHRWNYVSSVWPVPGMTGGVNFGWSLDVDLEAGLMAVGSNRYPQATPPGVPRAVGRVLVYRLIGDGQQPYQFQLDGDLSPPSPRENGEFGIGCAVLGPDRIAVSTGDFQLPPTPHHPYETYYEFERGTSGWTIARRGAWSDAGHTTFVHREDSVLYVGLPDYPAANRSGSAVIAYCLGADSYNPAGVYWQTNSGGYFPRTRPAIGRDFVAIGVSGHYNAGHNAGAVEVYPRLSSSDCLRATFGSALCGGGATGCPTGAIAPDPGTGCLNSSGRGARMHYTGSAQGAFNTGRMVVTGLPPGEFAVLMRGTLSLTGAQWNPAGHLALGSGVTCLVQPIVTAYPIRRASAAGAVEWFDILDRSPSAPSWGVHGGYWYDIPFQVWYRDRDGAGNATSNTSNALLLPIRLW
ncbi:MAG: hypothetical protein R3F49_24505 [Planctomycetota bacterium]